MDRPKADPKGQTPKARCIGQTEPVESPRSSKYSSLATRSRPKNTLAQGHGLDAGLFDEAGERVVGTEIPGRDQHDRCD